MVQDELVPKKYDEESDEGEVATKESQAQEGRQRRTPRSPTKKRHRRPRITRQTRLSARRSHPKKRPVMLTSAASTVKGVKNDNPDMKAQDLTRELARL